ncbi:hypothetical protein [Schnuerera ultunensis]|nr:hypothetical protein [Schnuerera ultunensis]
MKKKIALLLSTITIITCLSAAVSVSSYYIPPRPIRDSIVEEF